MTQMGFYFDQTRCTGCYTCAVACKDWHDIPAGPVNWMRIKTIEDGRFPNLFLAYLASPCYQCANPPCVLACPVEAISKRESDGIVVVDREKCLGNKECRTLCLNACPWDAPQFGPEPGAKMQKCDFCLERLQKGQQTICVEACPMYALDVGPLDELRKKYGDMAGAEGFRYSARFKPAAVFKPKRRPGK
jgi:anaerobic dimethyl sulfoxide reductase subunit B (iron-sulfur subunit)